MTAGRRLIGAVCLVLGVIGVAQAQDESSHVEAIQQLLEDQGCEPNGVDGQWGRGSAAAADRYFQVSGIRFEETSKRQQWPERYLEARCDDDLSIASRGELTTYETPVDTITLPMGIVQYNWIPADLRDFEWPRQGAYLVDLDELLSRFDEEALDYLGCNLVGDTARRIATSLRDHDTGRETVIGNDQPVITLASAFLEVAVCREGPLAFESVVDLFSHWAEIDAFAGYGLREAALEYRDTITRDRSAEWGDATAPIDQSLIYKEQLLEFLLLWNLTKQALPELESEAISGIEAWLQRMVEDQMFLYAKGPIDCPSFDAMPPGTHVMQPYIRRDQFETCINHGASRAGISALWALTSGDRGYAQDALNDFYMFLYSLRADGSHLLESNRGEIALYKAQYYLSYMFVIAEAFRAVGIDLYAADVQGKSLLTAAEFLAAAAFDPRLSARYSDARRQEPKEFKDGNQWVVLSRAPDSRAARMILRHMASVSDRERLQKKLFRLNPPGNADDGSPYWAQLLPFNALFAPADVVSYAPPDIAPRPEANQYCPEMGWTEADEDHAGTWNLAWGISDIFDGKFHHGGVDVAELSKGRGKVTQTRPGRYNPRRDLRQNLEIAYGGGRFCIAGMLNLFEPMPTRIVVIEGTFADGIATGYWPDGDEFRVELRR